jgi:hypothetical protein
MNSLHCLLIACALAAGIPLLPSDRGLSNALPLIPDWPSHFLGRALQELPLTAREQAFAKEFPGTVGRFTDGERDIVMRWVTHPTRRLHPAEDCYRALGYQIKAARIVEDGERSHWRCFEVSRGGGQHQVCEQIRDPDGLRWTDTSTWYWAALLERTHGPWLVTTVAAAGSV